MSRSRAHGLALALLSIAVVLPIGSTAETGQAPSPREGARADGGIALVGGTIIDGRGGTPVRDSVVLIRDRRVEAVGTAQATTVPAGYQRISTEGMSVLPGLWDMHTHLQYS